MTPAELFASAGLMPSANPFIPGFQSWADERENIRITDGGENIQWLHPRDKSVISTARWCIYCQPNAQQHFASHHFSALVHALNSLHDLNKRDRLAWCADYSAILTDRIHAAIEAYTLASKLRRRAAKQPRQKSPQLPLL